MVLQLLYRRRDKEWVFFVDKEAVEHELRVSHTLALHTNTLMELKRGDKRNQKNHHEVVSAVLTLLGDNLTATFIDQVVNNTIVFWISSERAKVHALGDSRLRIQESFLA